MTEKYVNIKSQALFIEKLWFYELSGLLTFLSNHI